MKEVYRMTKDELAKQYGMKGLTEEQAGDTAQPGSQPVNAVDQVDGIDDEDHD